MKVPAIRARIGIWVYYVSTLSFSQVKRYVKRVDDELHKSIVLQDMLQRTITDNYKSIANYIMQQEERFFNSIVLAIYDGDPKWHEVRLDYGDGDEFYDLGILELSGDEKIFPVDGQHRVEGIKKVVSDSNDFDNEKIPVIFIGHKKDDAGMKRARRMFSTLNRYAKPVSLRDIIALDEDDIIAIASRELIDNHPLFAQNRILDSKSKAIPESNNSAITTIITLYECNKELLRNFISDFKVYGIDGKQIKGREKLNQYIKFRPKEDEILSFISQCFEFWDAFSNAFDDIKYYKDNPHPNSSDYRNRDGGSLYFRPVALLPFVKAAIRLKITRGESYEATFRSMNQLPLQLNMPIWHNILWSPSKRTMIVNNQGIVELILLYCASKNLLTEKETKKLFRELVSIKNIEKASILEFLEDYEVK